MGIDLERERMQRDRNRKIVIAIIVIGVILCLVIPGIVTGIFAITSFNQKNSALLDTQNQIQTMQNDLDITRNQLVLTQSDVVALEDEYNQLQSNYDALNTRYGTLSQDYTALKANSDVTQGELSSSQITLKDQQTEIEKLQSQNEALTKTITRARAYADLLYSTLGPVLRGGKVTSSELQDLQSEWNDKLKVIDDPILDEKYSAWIDSDFGDKQFDDFLLYLIKTLFNNLK